MIILRDYVLADIDRFTDLANNENVSKYLIDTFPFPYTKQNAEWWIKIGSKANNAVTQAIEYQGELVGTIGISPQTGWKAHSAEMGYWIGEVYWGKGIATTALQRMSDLALSTMKYKKLFAPVLGPNKASMRVLEKCGYSLEGIFKHEVCKRGHYFDVHHYAKFCSLPSS